MRVAITGASGSVGRALTAGLRADGHQVHPLVRGEPGPGEIRWSVADQRIDAAALEGVDAVFHLAGETIGQRWTDAARARIRDSRVLGTRLLCAALAGLERKPSVLVASSAVGFYGDGGDAVLDEDSPPGSGFLSEVCLAWEAETAAARDAGIRVVNLRSGLALDLEHGFLADQLLPARMGVLGPIGGGRQYVSWIDHGDLIAAYRFCADHAALSGPVLGVAPNPVTQAEFARILGRVLGRPAFLPAPGFAMRVLFGEMAQELILEGQRCDPKRLREAGFTWRQPQLEPALRALLDG